MSVKQMSCCHVIYVSYMCHVLSCAHSVHVRNHIQILLIFMTSYINNQQSNIEACMRRLAGAGLAKQTVTMAAGSEALSISGDAVIVASNALGKKVSEFVGKRLHGSLVQGKHLFVRFHLRTLKH